MRSWSGLVDLLDGGALLGRAHADIAIEQDGDAVAWWAKLRGAYGYGLDRRGELTLRLPDGREGLVRFAGADPEDIYHRVDVDGSGPPPC